MRSLRRSRAAAGGDGRSAAVAACPWRWPGLAVRLRNTSSSDGRRTAMSATSMPASSMRRAAASSVWTRVAVGSVTRWSRTSAIGSPEPRPASRPTRRSTSLARVARTSSTSPPMRCLSSSEVPSAILRPRSITATRCASRSASSRYCVVSRSVVPSPTRSSIRPQSSIRERGSRPVLGSSMISTSGRPTRLAPRSRRRRMPPEYVRTRRSAASLRPSRSSTSPARARASRRRRP